MYRVAFSFLCALFLFWPTLLYAQSALEAPLDGQTCTGIGLVRGWACAAQNVTVTVDGGPPIPAATGGPRGDTRARCGRADTGFSLLLNWNEYGAGEHTLRLFVDNRLAATRTVEVVTLGQPFRDDLDGEWTFTDWPELGTNITVAWNEATQNIEIVDIHRRDPLDVSAPTCELGMTLEPGESCIGYYERIIQSQNGSRHQEWPYRFYVDPYSHGCVESEENQTPCHQNYKMWEEIGAERNPHGSWTIFGLRNVDGSWTFLWDE